MMTPRRNSGFTLLEVLLAIGLLALITSTILGGLHLGKRAWETGRDYESVHEVEEAASAIGAILARAFPVTLYPPNGGAIVAFHGFGNGFRAVTLSESAENWGGLALTEIGATGADLTIWTSVFRADMWRATSRESMRAAKALRGVEAFELAYFGALDPSSAPRWNDSWIDRKTLPQLISVRIGALRHGKRIDASLTIAIRQRPE